MGILLLAQPTNPPATIAPSGSWDGTTSWGGRAIPTESGTVHGSGWTGKAICAFDEPQHLWIVDDNELIVAAKTGDSSGIASVEFWLEGSTTTVTSKTHNSTKNTTGFAVTIQPPAGTDGYAELYAKVIPVNGYERLIGPLHMTLNKGGSLTEVVKTVKTSGGDYTSIGAALAAATGLWKIKVDAGTWTESGTFSINTISSHCPRVVPADGLSLGDVIVEAGTRQAFESFRASRTWFEDIQFKTDNIQVFYTVNDRIFKNCRFWDSGGAGGPEPPYGGTTPVANGFWRRYEGQRTYLVDCDVAMPECGNWTFARGTHFDCGADSGFFSSLDAADGTDVCSFNCTSDSSVEYFGRGHSEETLTVSTATYDGGTGRTTIVWASSPTLTDIPSSPAPSGYVKFLSGALSGQSFTEYSQTDSTDTTVVIGDASGCSPGDTAFSTQWESFHKDSLQVAISAHDVENFYFQRYYVSSDKIQCFFLQPGNGQEIRDWCFELCIFEALSNTAESSQMQHGHDHFVIDQCTMIGQTTEFRADFTGFAVANVVFRNSIFENLSASGTFPASGVTIDNNWFEEGTERGTNSGGGSSADLNASTYRPNGTSPVLGLVATPDIPYDYYGNPFGDDAPLGAVGPQP